MKIRSSAFNRGHINLNYGKFASSDFLVDGHPMVSFDLQWTVDHPNSRYLHFVFIDYDAIGASGKPFVHWSVANLDINEISQLPIDASRQLSHKLIQGFNSLLGTHSNTNHSFVTDLKIVQDEKNWEEFANFYGCCPPNADHLYTLHAFTTQQKLNVNHPFNPDYLFRVMYDPKYVVEYTTLQGWYPWKL